MDRARFLELLTTDGRLLLDAARHRRLDGPVPTCPGWTVSDAVAHTAEVYEHKIACIGLRGERPEPWPPGWPSDRDPRDWFADAHERLLAVLTATDPAEPSWTWWPDDQTAGFWVRRMAQETAVHRVDVQSAAALDGDGGVTPVDAELAVDGVDEVMVMMFAGDWSDEVVPELTGTVDVAAGTTATATTWRVAMTPDAVAVGPAADRGRPEGGAEARVSGDPSDVLLWLWGRAPDAAVRVDGDAGAAGRLRRRLAIATQ